MNRRERAKRVQEPMLRFLNSPTALMLPQDARAAFGELVMLLDELARDVDELRASFTTLEQSE